MRWSACACFEEAGDCVIEGSGKVQQCIGCGGANAHLSLVIVKNGVDDGGSGGSRTGYNVLPCRRLLFEDWVDDWFHYRYLSTVAKKKKIELPIVRGMQKCPSQHSRYL